MLSVKYLHVFIYFVKGVRLFSKLCNTNEKAALVILEIESLRKLNQIASVSVQKRKLFNNDSCQN